MSEPSMDNIVSNEEFVKIYIDCPKDYLLDRIKVRTQKMFPKLQLKNQLAEIF